MSRVTGETKWNADLNSSCEVSEQCENLGNH